VAYFVDEDADAPGYATREVERYCAQPARPALQDRPHGSSAPRTGPRRARAALRTSRPTTTAVLGCGRVPLDILNGVIDGYIVGAKGRGGRNRPSPLGGEGWRAAPDVGSHRRSAALSTSHGWAGATLIRRATRATFSQGRRPLFLPKLSSLAALPPRFPQPHVRLAQPGARMAPIISVLRPDPRPNARAFQALKGVDLEIQAERTSPSWTNGAGKTPDRHHLRPRRASSGTVIADGHDIQRTQQAAARRPLAWCRRSCTRTRLPRRSGRRELQPRPLRKPPNKGAHREGARDLLLWTRRTPRSSPFPAA